MFRSPKFARTLCLSLAFVSAVVPAGAAKKPPSASKPRVKIPGNSAFYVEWAVVRAGQRLAGERCLALLSEFEREADGQPLAVALEARGVTLEQHLATLEFLDGTWDRACRTGNAFAGLVRSGDNRVFVCPKQFRDLAVDDPVAAEVVIIHEVLHTLGLGENPPTGAAITARVKRRCVGTRD
jgi:hypothetical protein